MKIMIVEDDLILARELQLLCVKWNFQAKYLEDFTCRSSILYISAGFDFIRY